ncbi:alpha/beta hydrolase family protein [candidate division KSB1 bacterium]
MNIRALRFLTAVMVVLSVYLSAPVAQEKELTVDDYDQWQRFSTTVISNDAEWFAYNIRLVDGDGWLMLHNIASGDEKKFDVAIRPAFSNDTRWFAFAIDYPEKERKQMEDAKKPVRLKLGLMNLTTAEIDTLEGVSQFTFSDDSRFIAMKKYKAEGVTSDGSDLVLRNLEAGIDQLFGNVATHSFNEDGSLLALMIDAEEKFGNGVHLVRLSEMSLRVLDSYRAKYSNLNWNEEGDALAFLRAVENEDFENDNHLVFAFHELDERNYSKSVYDPGEDPDFTEGYRIVSEGSLRWSDDSEMLIFGVNEWKQTEDEEKKEEEEEPEGETGEEKKADKDADLPPAGVDVWHWKDEPVQPRQQSIASRLRNFTYSSIWHIKDNKFVQVARDDIRTVDYTGDHKYAVGFDQSPYEPIFEETWQDVYFIDTQTGEEKLLKKKFLNMSTSPGGKYLLYFYENDWWTYDVEKGIETNITEDIDARFENYTSIRGHKNPPAFGSSQWFMDDKAVIIYDRYDAYKIAPDGSQYECLTNGDEYKISYRMVRLDLDEDFIEPGKPVYFIARGDITKDSGYYRLNSGKKLEKLVYESRSVGGLRKAKDVDSFTFVREKADESPNVYFAADGDFMNAKRLTDTNPQQKDYYWGGTELITYTNKNGVELQGRLLYPANYQPGRQYPMIVYIYELRSQSLHSYTLPSRTSAYNQRRFSADGFFVYEPDIVYRINDPGVSAVECVVPAVQEVLKTGMINEDQIGLMGHSWGAYQTCFIVTQTDLFNAAVAGAPLINMVSMSHSIYWNSGTPNLNIFETSQGRLEEPFWEMPEKYWANSPLYQSQNITTPLMIAFGTEDGAVDWNQGVEMYTAMRRREKPFVMLVYEGENHGLAKKENQIDYAMRMHEWMKHYLLGEEPAQWITDGLPFLEKETKNNR